jgi:deoxyribonuclease V
MVFLIENALRAQELLSKYIVIQPIDVSAIDIVAGVDVSYRRDVGCATAVAYSLKSKALVTYSYYCEKVTVPYIPGLLAFREAPLMLRTLLHLLSKVRIDITFVNGHGMAHPRRCGIASHIGVVLNIPSIGVAKSLLYGEVVRADDSEAIVIDNMIVGYVLTKNSKKLYVSIGNKVTAKDAADITLKTWDFRYSLPEPLRLADEISRKIVKKLATKF